MMRVWIGVAVLAWSWLLGLSYFYDAVLPGPWFLLPVGVAAVLLAGAGVARPPRLAGLVAAVLAVPAVFLMPWPWRAAPICVVAGLVLMALPAPRTWPSALGRGLWTAGAILLVQAVFLCAYEAFTARMPVVPETLRHGLAWLLGLAGMDTAVDGQNVVLFAMRAKQPLAATWGLVLDPASLGFLVGGLAWLWLSPARNVRRPVVRLLVALASWQVVRIVLVVAVYLHRVLRTDYDAPLRLADQFWSPVYLGVLLVPAALVAWMVTRRWATAGPRMATPLASPAATGSSGRKAWRPYAAVFTVLAAVGVVTLTVGWHPSGPVKKGRVLIDEYHCEVDAWTKWRWPQKNYDTTGTLVPFDTTWFGTASGYNYATLYEYSNRYFNLGRVRKPLSDEVLKDCDVLVLKTPSKPFSRDEVEAVVRFVQEGGGLLLVGEHTNVYGSGVNLNRIARRFGFAFRYDCLFGIQEVFNERYTPPVVPHPIVQHLDHLDFAVSCSIDPGMSAGHAVIRNTGLKNLSSDNHVGNFYPQPEDRPEMLFGSFVQLWTTTSGQGRVAAFSDSTIFANFSVFDPGKSELFLGMLAWLNHRPPSGALVLLVVLRVILVLAAAWMLLVWRPRTTVVVSVALLGWVAASLGARALNQRSLPLPSLRHPGAVVRVAVDRSFTRCGLPLGGFIGGKPDHFGLFERSVQRLTQVYKDEENPGRTFTTFRTDQPEKLLTGDLVLFLYPDQVPDPTFVKKLVAYVEQGGHVLVLDAPENRKSTAMKLLEPFGLVLERDAKSPDGQPLQGTLVAPEGWPRVDVGSTLLVHGGQPFCSLEGRPVAASLHRGKGSVTVIGFGERFSDQGMGVTDSVVPDESVRRVFEFEYALLRGILNRGL